jgi:biopolymer transport protein ExbD
MTQPGDSASSVVLPLGENKPPEDLIDMTAMVDIVFFLLIFFLVTSLQSLQSVIDMPKAEARQGATGKSTTLEEFDNDPDFILLRIEEDDSIWVEDEQHNSDQSLVLALRNAQQGDSKPRRVLIAGHPEASHGAAVRAFDACAAAELMNISFGVYGERPDQ